ncbi:VENN motif pre-toxin domain-containing protein, partial [uncultured Xylophilus sp.]|uniref:VENN motif pre-toxin domain-containing protein n=1 Tax=uncultured Xylophilus sp. TaxID=296832 RepID=UPI0025F1C034
RADTTAFANMVAGVVAGVLGGNAEQIRIAAGAGANAAANNYLRHDEWTRYAKERSDCGADAACQKTIDKKYTSISRDNNAALALCDRDGSCTALIAGLHSGTEVRDSLIASGVLPDNFAAAANLQWIGQQLAVNPTQSATVARALDSASYCNENPGQCAATTVKAVAGLLAPVFAGPAAEAAIGLLVTTGRMAVAEATLFPQLGGAPGYCALKPEACMLIMETAAGVVSGALVPSAIPPGIKTVSTMAEALADDVAQATAKGYISATKVGEVACTIGNLSAAEQTLVNRIASKGDQAGALTEELFTSIARRTGMKVLSGGKYGSNNGFDLVLQDGAGNVTIVFNAKQMKPNGDIQLSPKGLGNTTQLSEQWVVNVAKKLDENSEAYREVVKSLDNGILKMAVGGCKQRK